MDLLANTAGIRLADIPRMEFINQISEIKKRAREQMRLGAVTGGYKANREEVIQLLNQALATEIVCVLRYQRHYQMADGLHGERVAEEFKEHADNEREHADRLSKRITQLGGAPNYSPLGLAERSHTDYVEGTTLLEMIREDLVAERIVIEIYSEFIRALGDDDPTTRRLLEDLLEDEEEHADDLVKLLARVHVAKTEAKPETPPNERRFA